MERQRYPIGQQDFANIRKEGKVYVDKTDLIYNLVNGSSNYVFLSRPRRFGKSLLLSTIRAYFEGEKELFEGLAIRELEKNWVKHPVLHLSLSNLNQTSESALHSSLEQQFRRWEKKYDVNSEGLEFSQRFAEIIIKAYETTGQRVVILIDEYDNPLINSLEKSGIYEKNRSLLKAVYSNLKDLDHYIRFGMITGITRFANTSIFSGLNNLNDISLDDSYANICGFTSEEIITYLMPGIERLAEKEKCSVEKAIQLLKQEYDGYHFSPILSDIYNPFSLLNCLDKSFIDNYWMTSGVPEFLVNKLVNSHEDFSAIFNSQTDRSSLVTNDITFDSPIALMYQTGYLTIKKYHKETRSFTLGIPNKEIEHCLFSLLGTYTPKENDGIDNNACL